jgi:nicotinamidase-related amidase
MSDATPVRDPARDSLLTPANAVLAMIAMNSWEDPDFRAAVERTGRKNLVLAGLWTEVCVAFPALDAIAAGYRVFVVADAIGGVSRTAHDSAMQRMTQAGAIPITVLGLACELQRDWGRPGAERLRGIMREYFGRMRSLKQ